MAKKKEPVAAKTDKLTHVLVPLHEKLSEKEKQELLTRLSITVKELPKISKKDPAVRHLDVKVGDVIKISRSGQFTGKETYFRGVIDA